MNQRGVSSCCTNPLCTSNTHNPTTKAIVVCALRRPTCPQNRAIDRNQAGMQTQQRKHMGVNPTADKDTPCRRQIQRKKKEGGTSAKSSVLRLTCVPLPHLVLPLSGCACSATPTKAKRGEAATHNWRWPNQGKGTTIGWAVGIIMNQGGVSSCCTNPLCKSNTHSQGHRVVCPSATHMSTKSSHRLKPSSSANTWVSIHQPTRTHHVDDKSKRKKKERGYISKEFCAKTDLCPLAKPATQTLRWPNQGKSTTIGWAIGITMGQWGCVVMLYHNPLCTSNTHSQNHRAVCRSATHVSTK